jgi:putative resolvase
MNNIFISGKQASIQLGVCNQTLYKYEKEGKLDTIRTPGGKRLYNVSKYLESLNLNLNNKKRRNICYARVSSYSQKIELENQINYMKQLYPEYEHLNDIGSGINFNRKNFNKILDYGIKGELNTLIITYKDRLCRIGNELVENILKKNSNTKIIILNNKEKSMEEEVIDDLIQIITVFSSRIYGLRSYKDKIIKNKNKIIENKNKIIENKIIENKNKILK